LVRTPYTPPTHTHPYHHQVPPKNVLTAKGTKAPQIGTTPGTPRRGAKARSDGTAAVTLHCTLHLATPCTPSGSYNPMMMRSKLLQHPALHQKSPAVANEYTAAPLQCVERPSPIRSNAPREIDLTGPIGVDAAKYCEVIGEDYNHKAPIKARQMHTASSISTAAGGTTKPPRAAGQGKKCFFRCNSLSVRSRFAVRSSQQQHALRIQHPKPLSPVPHAHAPRAHGCPMPHSVSVLGARSIGAVLLATGS
jgi:hypothetical protein